MVGSRELKERVGPEWKDALVHLRQDGYVVDETLGGSGNRSFRLNQDQPSGPGYSPERPSRRPLAAQAADHMGTRIRVLLTPDEIRTLLRLDIPAEVRDTLVGALLSTLDP